MEYAADGEHTCTRTNSKAPEMWNYTRPTVGTTGSAYNQPKALRYDSNRPEDIAKDTGLPANVKYAPNNHRAMRGALDQHERNCRKTFDGTQRSTKTLTHISR